MNTALYLSLPERQALADALSAWRVLLVKRFGGSVEIESWQRHSWILEAL